SEVRGQLLPRRAVEVAAAGGHNLLLVGPPGGGKTMMARRLPGILPPVTFDEALESTAIHSVAGILPPGTGLIAQRPFRAPHHTISNVALVGGGSLPRPGEISLAHNGVLFLDEMPEFDRRVLEVLRQPLGEGSVTVARARVLAARAAQQARYATARQRTNGELRGSAVIQYCRPDQAGFRLLRVATERLRLTARGYDRVLKVARTIADLAASEHVRED